MPGASARKRAHQIVPPPTERGHHPGDLRVHLLVGEGRRRRPLGRMVRPGGGVRLERRHGLGEVRRRQRRADAPAGHRVRLAGAVDDDGALEQLVGQVEQRRRRAGAVVDPAVDLVRDDPDLVLLGPLRDRAQLGAAYTRRPSGCRGSRG